MSSISYCKLVYCLTAQQVLCMAVTFTLPACNATSLCDTPPEGDKHGIHAARSMYVTFAPAPRDQLSSVPRSFL
jgi:hypothetical protein